MFSFFQVVLCTRLVCVSRGGIISRMHPASFWWSWPPQRPSQEGLLQDGQRIESLWESAVVAYSRVPCVGVNTYCYYWELLLPCRRSMQVQPHSPLLSPHLPAHFTGTRLQPLAGAGAERPSTSPLDHSHPLGPPPPTEGLPPTHPFQQNVSHGTCNCKETGGRGANNVRSLGRHTTRRTTSRRSVSKHNDALSVLWCPAVV